MTPTEPQQTMPLQDADLGASKPVPQPQPKARPFQLPTVIACGHRLDTRSTPKHANCQDCWDAFFETNVAALGQIHELLMTAGTRAVTAVHGAKFTEALGGYLRKQLLKMHTASTSEQLEVPTDVHTERAGV